MWLYSGSLIPCTHCLYCVTDHSYSDSILPHAASESGNISFLIPITNDAINIGRVNELSFALTGSEGSEVTTTIRLQVQGELVFT